MKIFFHSGRFMIYVLFAYCFLMTSCEEVIDLDLDTVDPKIVIVADLNNIDDRHVIYVSKTVAFDDNRKNEVVQDAIVQIQDVGQGGAYHTFVYDDAKEGYVNDDLRLKLNSRYRLYVEVGDQYYDAYETVNPYIEVDSLGRLRENILNEDYYFATFKFQDPAREGNYYKYNVSVDGKPMKFYAVYNDKYNNGLSVTHQIGSVDDDIEYGSNVRVRRQIISYPVFKYWNEIQSTNPALVSPMNPTSNISNEALGYFSVSFAKDYSFDFYDFSEVENSEEEEGEDE